MLAGDFGRSLVSRDLATISQAHTYMDDAVAARLNASGVDLARVVFIRRMPHHALMALYKQ